MTSAPTTEAELPFRVYRPILPQPCPSAPHRMVFTGDADGRCEVFTWDSRTASARQVTDRPGGTMRCAIDAEAYVWWFAETVDGIGHWQVQPFEGGPDRPGLSAVPEGRPAGLAMNDRGDVVVGVSDEGGLSVWRGRRGEPGQEVFRTPEHAAVIDIDPSGQFAALGRQAASARAVTVISTGGDVVSTLSGTGRPLWGLGFAPGSRAAELLLVIEDGADYRLGTWTAGAGLIEHAWCSFDSEITARWYPDEYPDDRRVLVRQDRQGRSRLLSVDLDRRTRTHLDLPTGSVLDAAARPGGDLHYLWTNATTPPQVRSLHGIPLPGLDPEPDLVVPGRCLDLWTAGPGGDIHTLLTVPEKADPALVFLVHGGPATHDRDAYDAVVHSLVASGLAVARVNYRGSTGYGPRWRAAAGPAVGLAQVADLVAVRADLLERGLARPDAVGLWGTSWGGYLVLLAAGTHPDLWQAAVAVKPIADSVLAFRTGTPALRALDTALFGGTPEQVPDRYARASPISYAGRVRAPLLVLAGAADVKCPPEQVRSYLAALREHGIAHEAHWLPSGHDGHEGREHVEILRRSITFLGRRLLARPARTPGSRPDSSGARKGSAAG